MAELLTSVGIAGKPDFDRSEGRAYLTIEHLVTDINELRSSFSNLKEEGLTRGRRRVVLKAEVSSDVIPEITTDLINHGLPYEVIVPKSVVDPNSTNSIVYIGENIHPNNLTGNVEEVYKFWRNREELANLATTPLESLDKPGFELTVRPNKEDGFELYNLWRNFGWNRDMVSDFIKHFGERKDLWFSGLREKRSGNLVAVCLGEAIRFGETLFVEGTEYATDENFGKKGLATAAVVGLHAQILNDTLYKNGEIPMITSEFNIESRADMVGYKTGMHVVIPDEGAIAPQQILHKNVSVLDNKPINDLSWNDLGEQKARFRNAYRTPYRYWRDFVVGVLPFSNLIRYYNRDQVTLMLRHYEGFIL